MLKNHKISIFILGALALSLVFGLITLAPSGTAFAAEPAAQKGPETPDGNHGHKRGGRQGAGFRGDGTYLAEALGITPEELQAAQEAAQANFGGPGSEPDMHTLLAEALGISVEELDAAREAAQAAALEQALADGRITEEQLALMEARQALKDYIQKDEMLATALGITVDELETARENGQHIPDLLEELGLTQDDFEANMQAAHEENLQQAVADGVITQEQADLLLANPPDRPHRPHRPGNGAPDGSGFQRPGQSNDQG